MLICQHRVNDPNDLHKVPPELGVEIDLRSDGQNIYLAHDPFVEGPLFSDWLDFYNHSFIVLNIKEEGLETAVVSMLESRGVTEWAFLDQSFPFLVKSLRSGSTQNMVRISEFERTNTAFSLTPRPDWVWLDSFTGTYPAPSDLVAIHERGFKIMLVSPELQGREPEDEVNAVKALFESAHIALDGVCTKRPALWHE